MLRRLELDLERLRPLGDFHVVPGGEEEARLEGIEKSFAESVEELGRLLASGRRQWRKLIGAGKGPPSFLRPTWRFIFSGSSGRCGV